MKVVDRRAPQRDEKAEDGCWSDEKKCRGCNKEGGAEKYRLCHCPSRRKIRNQIPIGFGDVGTKSKNVEGGLAVAKRHYVVSSRRK